MEDKIIAYYKQEGSTLKVCTEKKSDDWIEFCVTVKNKEEQKSP